jgi:hypothetical protein
MGIDLLAVHDAQGMGQANQRRRAHGPVSLAPVPSQFPAGPELQPAVLAAAGMVRGHHRCPALDTACDQAGPPAVSCRPGIWLKSAAASTASAG